MARNFDSFQPDHLRLIAESPVFFVATAAPDGRVNLSPKGYDSLRITGPASLIWRNLTGSGNETAGHLLRANRITLMWCSFGARPIILRAFGSARTIHRGEAGWADLDARFPADIGARQIFEVTVDLVRSSCGYGVPLMDFAADRDTMARWAEDRGPEGIPAYWRETNARTIDGFPTGIPGANPDRHPGAIQGAIRGSGE